LGSWEELFRASTESSATNNQSGFWPDKSLRKYLWVVALSTSRASDVAETTQAIFHNSNASMKEPKSVKYLLAGTSSDEETLTRGLKVWTKME
jgi:hypothetical protein